MTYTAGLRPALLDDLGIISAIEWQAIAVFRIVQQGLTNILRHAGATAVEGRLNCDNERPRQALVDDDQSGPLP